MKMRMSMPLVLALVLSLALGGVSAMAAGGPETLTDPSGAQITVPETIGSIVVLAPSIAEEVVALGRGDDVVAYDAQSVGLEGLGEDLPVFDLVEPDMEQLMALEPDLLLVSNMSLYDETSPYQQLIDLGVCVACIPNAESIEGIYGDIGFLGELLDEPEAAQGIIDDMKADIAEIAAIGETVEEKKTVYFEISAAPYMYSFGSGVYLDEMISLIGAENVLADQEGWLPVAEEDLVAADPDVILTNVNYIDGPVEEIMARPGWEGVTAVADGAVYYIDNMASSLPDQNIVTALRQMAQAVYPDYFPAEAE